MLAPAVTPLTALHLLYPVLLALPLLSLLRPKSPPAPPLPGIIAINVQTITPRRRFILVVLLCLLVTAVFDGIILIFDLLTANHREYDWNSSVQGWALAAGILYTLGGFAVWSLAIILLEVKDNYGAKALVVLGTLGLVLETPNFVLLVLREIHTGGSEKIFTILSIPPSGLRLLLLPIFLYVVSSPVVKFQRADESTRLLANEASAESSSAAGRDSVAYGTFGNQANGNGTKQPGSTVAPTGTNTPAEGGAKTPAAVKRLAIHTKLGNKKAEEAEKELEMTAWEFWDRFKVLIPKLWPSSNAKLQVYVLICLVCLLAGRFITPAVPIFLGLTVRALTKRQTGDESSDVWLPFAAWTLLRVLNGYGGLSFLKNMLWLKVQQHTDREMQITVFQRLLYLSLAWQTKRNTGEVTKILDRGSALNNLFNVFLYSVLPTFSDMIIAVAVFYYFYGWPITLMLLVLTFVYVSVSISSTNRRRLYRRQQNNADVITRGVATDVLTNWESVKFFTAENREVERYREAIVTGQVAETKVYFGYYFLNFLQAWILLVGLFIGALIVAIRVMHRQADAAEFVIFIQYMAQLSGPLDSIGYLYRQLLSNMTDAEKLLKLLDVPSEVEDKPGAKDLVVTDGVIEFDDVHFSYDGKVPALKGVSFKIGKGESLALVGESGSGKSTILRLLYRFYDLETGHIYIDGQDISQVTQESLRKAIGIVPQDSVLWNDTVGANIGYGKEDADDEDIIAAAKAAKLHDKILGFAEGYDTMVGERGVRLSGGEKQRVSLARMFLKSPAILVLDEATSALDTTTEREIQKSLAELSKGRSSLSIAHRLSTIINSDQIVVMGDGQVIESGSYKDLMEKQGAFASMWRKQIFTEAEMVAKAEAGEAGIDAEALDKALAKTEENLKQDQGGEGGAGGDEAIVSEGTDKSEEREDVSGFRVESSGEAIASAPTPEDDKSGPQLVEDPTSDQPIEAGATQAETPKQPSVPAPITKIPQAVSYASAAKHAEAKPSEGTAAESPTKSPSPEDTSPSKGKESVRFPAGPVPFPSSLPRVASGLSQTSSTQEGSRPSSPPKIQSTPNTSNADIPTEVSSDKKEKRKRMTSLKAFARRISDQNTVTRSNSFGSNKGEPDETANLITAGNAGGSRPGTPLETDKDKKKNRFSFQKPKDK
ncbi:hypothetical protein P7C73_g4077, partial [Tremellales sp. Uapishka_1]